MYANGMPTASPMQPAMRHAAVAVFSSFAAMQRAWKSIAARLPNARMMIVDQFQKMAFGNGVSECGSSISLPTSSDPPSPLPAKMGKSPNGYAPLSATHVVPLAGHHLAAL